MNSPARPVLTVRSNRSEVSFAPGGDVIVGSDVRADLRVAHPLVTRAHLLLRFDHGRWVAVDNNSRNGIFADGRRVPMVDIRDGQTINLGGPDGPRIGFAVGHHQGAVGLLPPTTHAVPTIPPPDSSLDRPTDALHTTAVPIVRPTQAVPQDATQVAQPAGTDMSQFPTRVMKVVGPGSDLQGPTAGTAWIGRELDNDIVIHDVLASRHHAVLEPTPAGIEIRDANSINGTFVNGVRVGSALLAEGDVVTIGNVDLVFTAGMLARRQEAATRTGGLEVREVGFAINGKDLLQQISMAARPGTLTAIIGGSGAGKSTLSRLIAGYTTPTSGSVTFEGHNIHTAYASLRSRIGMVPQDDVVHRQLTVNHLLRIPGVVAVHSGCAVADRSRSRGVRRRRPDQ
jgi:pSer/pThr/pTyr-binding forkhead associated (FHA) protein